MNIISLKMFIDFDLLNVDYIHLFRQEYLQENLIVNQPRSHLIRFYGKVEHKDEEFFYDPYIKDLILNVRYNSIFSWVTMGEIGDSTLPLLIKIKVGNKIYTTEPRKVLALSTRIYAT